MKRLALIIGILRIGIDFLMIFLAFFIARFIRTFTDLIPGIQFPIGYIPSFEIILPFVFFASLLFIVIMAFQGMYQFNTKYMSFFQEAKKVIPIVCVWLVLLMSYFFAIRDFFFSRLVLFYTGIFAILFILLGRSIIRLFLFLCSKQGIGVSNLLIIGNGNLAYEIAERYMDNPLYNVKGVVISEKRDGAGDTALGFLDDLENIAHTYDIDEILHISDTKSKKFQETQDLLSFCHIHHIRYRLVPDLMEIQKMNVQISDENGIPLIEFKSTPLDGVQRIIKRSFDMFIAGICFLILLPFMILVALFIKIDSPGPIFFFQKRVGVRGKEFTCIKFRTMVKDAEALKAHLLAQSERSGPLFKMKDDPRITRLGKFLRTFSIDELPQLINVLQGTMSLVGPRPHLPAEVSKYEANQKILFAVKPGITGMAQVNGRSSLHFEDEVHFDLYYIQNWSLWLDIKILIKTFWVVIKGENAG